MPWLSPDCRDGNPQKCDGLAWNTEIDDVVDCESSQHRDREDGS